MINKIVNYANPEWFREPSSQLELTLRRPYLRKYILILFLRRILIKWFFLSVVLRLVSLNTIISILIGFLVTLLYEVFTLRNYYEFKAVPRQQKNFYLIKKQASKVKKTKTRELVQIIEESVKISTKSLTDIAYCALAVIGWLVIFKALYSIITKSDIHYHKLLLGLKNKEIESNQKLWEVSQIKDKEKQKTTLTKYLSEFGSKADDFELSKPTLTEQPKVINKLIELYSKTESPFSVVIRRKEIRDKATKRVLKNLRVPKSFFQFILKKTHDNIVIREGRRYYALLPSYYIRVLILELADRLEITHAKIFEMSWEEIKEKAK